MDVTRTSPDRSVNRWGRRSLSCNVHPHVCLSTMFFPSGLVALILVITMLQNLLIDRFKITSHHEQREVTMYDLVVVKGGPKMKPSTVDQIGRTCSARKSE